ncbi:[citrate (pro-3S)-lyase] ligase [Clostridiaceae bacterium 35-E11]
MDRLTIEKINVHSEAGLKVETFLSTFDLVLDKDVEYTVVIKDKNEIIGTCSYAGNVIKCFAVKKGLQQGGIAGKLITHITDVLFHKGIYKTFIFTKPLNAMILEGLNYRKVHETKYVVLLEGGLANVERTIKKMFEQSGLGIRKKAALVMNCNPFTWGHRYLIEEASKENEEVVVFVVEENRSLFPFKTRLELVKKGTADLKNVHVLAGGEYIISSATFPSYFLRQEDERLEGYVNLDAGIFGKYIAPAFHVDKRYVGTEPYCKVTNQYNEALSNILPRYGVEVRKIKRLTAEEKNISASVVRGLIKNENWEEVKKLVPQTTYEFLISHDAEEIVERIKRKDCPH